MLIQRIQLGIRSIQIQINLRRDTTLVVSYACRTAPDEACFCVSVGLSPSSEQGSDIVLYALDESTVAVNFVVDWFLHKTSGLKDEH